MVVSPNTPTFFMNVVSKVCRYFVRYFGSWDLCGCFAASIPENTSVYRLYIELAISVYIAEKNAIRNRLIFMLDERSLPLRSNLLITVIYTYTKYKKKPASHFIFS